MTGRAQEEPREREFYDVMQNDSLLPLLLGRRGLERKTSAYFPNYKLLPFLFLAMGTKSLFCRGACPQCPNVSVISECPTKLTHSIGRKDMPETG